MTQAVHRFPVLIPAGDGYLAGVLYRDRDNLIDPQPGVVTSGSWLTVKEQMAATYAEALVAHGYTVLTFDFAGWGASPGSLPNTEIPLRKVKDIDAATRYLRSLACVRGDRVGYLAICASAMYAAAAIEAGAPIGTFVSVAGWLHDTSSVAAFYGGEPGVARRLQRAAMAMDEYRAQGTLPMVPAYEAGNESAGMFFPLDYYANPARGRLAAWRNQMSELTWAYWLTFDGLRAARSLNVPSMFVHGDECALPDNVRSVYESIKAAKRLVWHEGSQVDYYDRDDLVSLSVKAAHEWFSSHLSRDRSEDA